MTSRSVLLPLSTLAAAIALLPAEEGAARADEKAACVAASDQAQTLRDEGKYRAARASLMECARDACPTIVRRDCEKWLAELDASQPTLVFGARDPKGNDVDGTRVLLDGAPLVERLDGKPVPVDPGEHVFRYEAPGAAPVEQHVVVRVNEKNRTLTAILMPQANQTAAPLPPPPVDATARDTAAPRAPIPAAAWVFLGTTIVAAGSFAFFGLTGQNDVANMRAAPSAGGCAPNCPQSQVDAARTKLLVADVSLGVGVVSLALDIWFFVHRGSAPRATAFDLRPEVEARPGGAVAGLHASF